MDIISFNEASTANGRIESFIENPDSMSGIVTVPKIIASGETITIPAGRVAVLPNVQVDGVLNVDGEVFVPSGSTYGDLDEQIALKAPLVSPAFIDTPTLNGEALVKLSSDGLRIEKADNASIKNQCTAWANIDMTTTPPTIRDSYGISGIVRTATGRLSGYVSMDRNDYIVIGSGEISQDGINASPALFVNPSRNLLNTTSQFNIEVRGTDNNNYNAKLLEIFIIGGKN